MVMKARTRTVTATRYEALVNQFEYPFLVLFGNGLDKFEKKVMPFLENGGLRRVVFKAVNAAGEVVFMLTLTVNWDEHHKADAANVRFVAPTCWSEGVSYTVRDAVKRFRQLYKLHDLQVKATVHLDPSVAGQMPELASQLTRAPLWRDANRADGLGEVTVELVGFVPEDSDPAAPTAEVGPAG